MNRHGHDLSDLDAATAGRLARLADRPVDTAALEARLAGALSGAPRRRRRAVWLRPAMGLAASIVVAVGVLLAVLQAGPDASAGVLELSRLHHGLVSGEIPVAAVESIEQANAWIDRQRRSAPDLPVELAGATVQSCCLAHVQGELVAVALVTHAEQRVTLVVAEAPHFGHAMGQVYERDGRRLFGHRIGDVEMVMAQDGDRWLCVMGDLPPEALADLAAAIAFGESG